MEAGQPLLFVPTRGRVALTALQTVNTTRHHDGVELVLLTIALLLVLSGSQHGLFGSARHPLQALVVVPVWRPFRHVIAKQLCLHIALKPRSGDPKRQAILIDVNAHQTDVTWQRLDLLSAKAVVVLPLLDTADALDHDMHVAPVALDRCRWLPSG